MSHAAIGGLVICLLFVLFSLGIEIGFAMALAGFIGFAAVVNIHAAMNLLAKDFFSVLKEIVEIYNRRLAEVETDLSLQIEIR